jgi:hypothetical protein
LRAGNIQEAIADLTKASMLDPEEDHPSANRARLLLNMTQSAIQMVQENGVNSLKNLK